MNTMKIQIAFRASRRPEAQEALQRNDFAGGLARADTLLAKDPKDGDALYVAAVAARYRPRHSF